MLIEKLSQVCVIAWYSGPSVRVVVGLSGLQLWGFMPQLGGLREICNKWSVVVDGKEGKEYDMILSQGDVWIIFDSPDTLHYIAQKDNNIYLVEERIK